MAHSILNSGSSNSVASKNKDEENSLLWKYMTRIEKIREWGGSWKWTCSLCGLQKFGTYTRVKAHLLNINGKGIICCKNVSPEIIA